MLNAGIDVAAIQSLDLVLSHNRFTLHLRRDIEIRTIQ